MARGPRGCADARLHQLSSPLLRALDLACVKRPICLVQDGDFGVLHQVIAVSLQPVGNPIACAGGWYSRRVPSRGMMSSITVRPPRFEAITVAVCGSLGRRSSLENRIRASSAPKSPDMHTRPATKIRSTMPASNTARCGLCGAPGAVRRVGVRRGFRPPQC
jgi:hypothetical protein